LNAATLYAVNEPLEIADLRQDPPKAGEVRVDMGAAGLCASDHHVMTGTAVLPLPVVLGHEGAGTVVEVGEGVTRVKPGDRCILSFVSNCGHCRLCRTGNPQLCTTNQATGTRQYDGTVRLHDGDTDVHQMGKLGVFSESIVIPQQACHPMPDRVPMAVAALIGCCVTTGVGSVINMPAARPGMSVAVFGCGGVGLSVIQGARLMNASKVIAVDIYDHKLEFSYKFGATDVVNSREVDPVEAIREITGDGVDMAFDSFGSAGTLNSAVMAVRRAGTAVMIGLGAAGETAPIDMVEFLRDQKSLVSSYYGAASPHETFDKLVGFYLKGELDVDSLITRRYGLADINEGFDALARGEDGRGVIVFDS
jgi:S-(hydroxymethyl)glutathione dehydrogenase/alcohol dehydrogenase